jgi:hypothetical protein
MPRRLATPLPGDTQLDRLLAWSITGGPVGMTQLPLRLNPTGGRLGEESRRLYQHQRHFGKSLSKLHGIRAIEECVLKCTAVANGRRAGAWRKTPRSTCVTFLAVV